MSSTAHPRTLLRNTLVASALAGLATGLFPAAPAIADPPLADLAVDLAADRTEILDSGDWRKLTVDLRNVGARASQDITLNVQLPDGAWLGSDGFLIPPDWQCDFFAATCTHAPLDSGAAAGLLEVPFGVPPGTEGDVITLGVTVSTGPESSTANNTDTVDLRYIPATVDLEVTDSSPDRQVIIGEVVGLQPRVRNAGTGPSGQVVVTVPLPAGMTRYSEYGDGWDCLFGSDPSGPRWRCTHDPLRAGETAPAIDLSATVTGGNPGDVLTLTATASTTSTETTLDNNTVQTEITVLQAATVRGTVWFDSDRDGVWDTGEQGIPGEWIDRIVVYPQTEGQPAVTATVNPDGTYVAQMRPGTHRVEFYVEQVYNFTASADSDLVYFDNNSGYLRYGYSGWFTLAGGEETVIDAAVV